jgi:hypothetical protein
MTSNFNENPGTFRSDGEAAATLICLILAIVFAVIAHSQREKANADVLEEVTPSVTLTGKDIAGILVTPCVDYFPNGAGHTIAFVKADGGVEAIVANDYVSETLAYRIRSTRVSNLYLPCPELPTGVVP